MLRKAFSFLLAAVLGAALGVGGLLLWQRENSVGTISRGTNWLPPVRILFPWESHF